MRDYRDATAYGGISIEEHAAYAGIRAFGRKIPAPNALALTRQISKVCAEEVWNDTAYADGERAAHNTRHDRQSIAFVVLNKG